MDRQIFVQFLEKAKADVSIVSSVSDFVCFAVACAGSVGRYSDRLRSGKLKSVIHSFQFISVNLVYKDTENVMFIILGVTKHIFKENNNYKQQDKYCCRYVINMHY